MTKEEKLLMDDEVYQFSKRKAEKSVGMHYARDPVLDFENYSI